MLLSCHVSVLAFAEAFLLKNQQLPHGVSEVKTEANGCKNQRCKTLIYRQYLLTNGKFGYWRLALFGVILYRSCTTLEGSHGTTTFQQRATAFKSVQQNFFDYGPSK